MGVICMPNHMTKKRQQCVHTHSQIMRYHTGNEYCDVVPNVQALSSLTRKHMISIPTPVFQLVFKFIIWLHVVQNLSVNGSLPCFIHRAIIWWMLKTEGLGKSKFTYMKHIKIQSCHIGVIFTPKHMTWQSKQCVHNHSQIMRYHTGNMYCGVVLNVQALIFLTRKQMIIILTLALQFVF